MKTGEFYFGTFGDFYFGIDILTVCNVMRKNRTYEQLKKIESWIIDRNSTKQKLRDSSSLHDLMSIPTVMTDRNIKAVENFERSILGDGFRFPREGEKYVSKDSIPALSLVDFTPPSRYFSHGEGEIPIGTLVRIGTSGRKNPIIYTIVYPLEPQKLEHIFVQKKDRRNPDFKSYGLFVRTYHFKDGFKKIENEKWNCRALLRRAIRLLSG